MGRLEARLRDRGCVRRISTGSMSSAWASRVTMISAGELGLRRAKTAKRATGDVVGVDGIAIDRDVGHIVAAGGEESGNLVHFDAGGGIGAAIGDDLGLDGHDLPIALGAPAAADLTGWRL